MTSNSFTVSPASASALVFSTQPGSATAGAVFAQQPVVKSRDGFGNDSTVGLARDEQRHGHGGEWHWDVAGHRGLNIGTGGGNGTVSFTNLRIDAAGAKTLQAAAAASLGTVTSNSFTVSPAAAERVAALELPSSMAVPWPVPARSASAIARARHGREGGVTDAFGNVPAITTVSMTVTDRERQLRCRRFAALRHGGTVSTTAFTVTHQNNANNSAVITVHVTSGGTYTDPDVHGPEVMTTPER